MSGDVLHPLIDGGACSFGDPTLPASLSIEHPSRLFSAAGGSERGQLQVDIAGGIFVFLLGFS